MLGGACICMGVSVLWVGVEYLKKPGLGGGRYC